MLFFDNLFIYLFIEIYIYSFNISFISFIYIFMFLDVLSFFMQRRLFTAGSELIHYVLGPQKDPTLTQYDHLKKNKDLSASFRIENDVFFALKTFSRGSVMFASRFDDPLALSPLAPLAATAVPQTENEVDRQISD